MLRDTEANTNDTLYVVSASVAQTYPPVDRPEPLELMGAPTLVSILKEDRRGETGEKCSAGQSTTGAFINQSMTSWSHFTLFCIPLNSGGRLI